MSTIRRNIIKHMVVITLTMAAVLLSGVYLTLVTHKQSEARETALLIAERMDRILQENRESISEEMATYEQERFADANAADFILLQKPSFVKRPDRLREIAELLNASELHLIDKQGVLYAGTNPDFFGTRLESGTQLSFFLPMLEDPELRLSQPFAQSDLSGALTQYVAVWSKNGRHIIMLGFQPNWEKHGGESCELSRILSFLPDHAGVKLCALDKDSYRIIASTDTADTGKPLDVLGFDSSVFNESNLVSGQYVFQANPNGTSSYCIFSRLEDCLAGYIVPNAVLYDGLVQRFWSIGLVVVAVAIVLVLSVVWYMGKDVITDIHSINEALGRISAGSLKRSVDIRTNREFNELSKHINEVVSSLLATTDKMSYVLSRTNVRMGVYEYSKNYGETVRYTEYVPELLGLNERDLARLTTEGRVFEDYIKTLKQEPLPDEENVYCVRHGEQEVYLKFDDVIWRNDIFGIVVDMTKEIVMRRRIESERDIDPLTNLWNRRGVNRQLSDLFKEPELLGHGVIIMVDTDDLKKINDTWGHEFGDSYLQKVAELIGKFGTRNNVSARLGGDEFVCLLYGYRSEQELAEDVARFHAMQDSIRVTLEGSLEVTVRFSAGFSEIWGQNDYHTLLRAADERMYADKRSRKHSRCEDAE